MTVNGQLQANDLIRDFCVTVLAIIAYGMGWQM